jgi:2-keto-4-pentenoate hydratase/2-oxohepta-3-ene-1,7-dioic acid hydratase in catechol pathway
MKLCRFNNNRLGLVDGQTVADVSEALAVLPPVRWPAPPGDLLIANLEKVKAEVAKLSPRAKRIPLKDVKLNSPVANPVKVIGAPVNYIAHAEESAADAGITFGKKALAINEAGFFLKNPVPVGPAEGVALHFTDRRNDHEVELTIVIGKQGRNIPRERALDHVAGYAIGLDMVIRGTEERSLRKAIDSYSVLGPWLVTADEIPDPDKLDFSLRVGNEQRQKSNTNKLIFDCRKCIEYASTHYTLYPGDIIMTGTPEGVGPVKNGDVMHCWAEKIGEMDIPVRDA